MTKFLLWLILLIICWPSAIVAIILYPIIWLVLLPFRFVDIAVDSIFDLIKAIFRLPSKILGA